MPQDPKVPSEIIAVPKVDLQAGKNSKPISNETKPQPSPPPPPAPKKSV
jgi:hypothetical protein